MSAKTELRSGLFYGWSYGENGWNTGMDANLMRLGRFGFHLSAKARQAEPPISPADGDTYIVTAGTGLWDGLNNRVVVWEASSNSWVDASPRIGWICYIEAEEVLSAYKASGWSAGLAI